MISKKKKKIQEVQTKLKHHGKKRKKKFEKKKKNCDEIEYMCIYNACVPFVTQKSRRYHVSEIHEYNSIHREKEKKK